jgi:hypothetical protein
LAEVGNHQHWREERAFKGRDEQRHARDGYRHPDGSELEEPDKRQACGYQKRPVVRNRVEDASERFFPLVFR